MPPDFIFQYFKLGGFEPRERVYLTVRALEIAGFQVDTRMNLAILSGEI